MTDYLSELQLHVMQVPDAVQALAILREASRSVELLFTDVKMPGSIDGMQLARLVTATWPSIPVLIASGHIRPTPDEMPARSRFLPKPYTFTDLRKMIAELAPRLLINSVQIN